MPSKLFIHVEPDVPTFTKTTPDFVELCRLPLEGGRSYLVQAKGTAGLVPSVLLGLKLDVFGISGVLLTSQESVYVNNPQQFMLMAAATLPAEGGGGTLLPPGASAILSAKASWPSPSPTQSFYVANIILMALSVDEVVVA